MKTLKTAALATVTGLSFTMAAQAADYTDGNIHKNDYSWSQFNLMYSIGEKPENPASGDQHNYLEMEFGGRSGIFDLYGYVDVFNLGNQDTKNGDKNPGSGASKLFMKFAPRVSLDAVTGKDLSFGPVKEVYIATLFNWGGDINTSWNSVNSTFWGIGADVEVPWLGKSGLNLYAFNDMNKKDWNGYQLSMNWFRPVHFFADKSFLAFQGYFDYQFGADATAESTSNGGAAFFGLYWHSERYALGYGLKGYKDVYLLEDGAGVLALESTGWSHYFAATYKF